MEYLKDKLPRAWSAIFAQFGNFTEVQKRAIPVILAGRDTLIVAATASGKTEAALAPLIERHLKAGEAETDLNILYICPTKALVKDLYVRLAPMLGRLNITLGMKSGDTAPVSKDQPPTVLITTPESVDSLLTQSARLFTSLQAIVLDEIHLFDGSVRGDQLRSLLERIEVIREYAGLETPCQRVALSATVAKPQAVAARYLHKPVVVQVEGGRELAAELIPLADLSVLSTVLAERSRAKTLIFCNTRAEVEQVAAFLRAHLAFEAAIFVHYSNLDTLLRREVEQQFADASVAICISSSTLELGIDIGSIDEVTLLGAPPTSMSLLQRIGRGGRRSGKTEVLCFFRNPREWLRFQALLSQTSEETVAEAKPYAFKPSVLVQQVFSLLKQSPTGGIRFADLRRLAPAELSDTELHDVLEHLIKTHYLRKGRPGEWQVGQELAELADEHEIYSNIAGEFLGARIVDAYSGRPIAQAERPRNKGETLLMAGQSMEVAWQDRYIYGVQKDKKKSADEVMRFRTTPFAIGLNITQQAASLLGLHAGEMPVLEALGERFLFHFWGDIYGLWLAALLQMQFGTNDDEAVALHWNELCLKLRLPLDNLPTWDEALALRALKHIMPDIEAQLELGRFHSLLPTELAAKVVLKHSNIAVFKALYQAAILKPIAAKQRAQWQDFLY